ncbi:MAG TPA: ribose-phosphate diphosphokinase [Steroidobacteraceae bacterium]|nr:ribose-phosphate diphosphokinase [Steroidobacteraceae bacterium]
MPETPRSSFLALSESASLGTLVCREAGLRQIPLEERRFQGGEFKLRPLESVRGHCVYVLQTLAGSPDAPVAERLVRLLFLLNTLRDAGAARRVVIIPYLAYARKERRTQTRDPVHTRYVAQLLESSAADQLMLLDVHNPAATDNAFRIPLDHLTALPMMADHFARRLGPGQIAVVSPDVGGIKRAQIFREMLTARLQRPIELLFAEKRRVSGAVSSAGLVGDPAGRQAIIIDDLCATGGTLLSAAEMCRDAGAACVHAAVSHAPLTEGLDLLIAAGSIDGIVTTDSVGSFRRPDPVGKLTILSVAPLFGQAIRRTLAGIPLAPLLSRWPVTDAD